MFLEFFIKFYVLFLIFYDTVFVCGEIKTGLNNPCCGFMINAHPANLVSEGAHLVCMVLFMFILI